LRLLKSESRLSYYNIGLNRKKTAIQCGFCNIKSTLQCGNYKILIVVFANILQGNTLDL